jgi:hypothetical protein
MKRIYSLLLICLLPVFIYSQAVVKFPGGTIAYSSDGNQHDKDDWVATALAQGLIWSVGLESKVVHCDHSNHLGNNNGGWETEMVESSYNGAKRWGIDQNIVFNDQKDLTGAINNFKKIVVNISATEPLWFICAGPMETAWRCLDAVNKDNAIKDKLQYIHCISHSTWNEGHNDTPQMNHTWSTMKDDFKTVTYHDILDQNSSDGDNDFNTPFAKWYWLRDFATTDCPKYPDMADDFRWIYTRNDKNTFDPSDAGMTYWLISGGPNGGDQKGGWPETEDLFKNPRRVVDTLRPSTPGPITVNSEGSITANISWGPSTDDQGISRYEIYVNNAFFSTSTTTTADLNGITCDATSSVKVRAVDFGNNTSDFNTPVNVTTTGPCPTCPVNLIPSVSGGNGPETGQTAYTAMNLSLSGLTILAENVDNGDNGVAYYDFGYGGNTDPVRPVWSTEHGFRLDSDIEFDDDGTGNTIIGGINIGEWAEYTINVTEPCTYKLTSVKYSTNSGVTGKLYFKMDNEVSCVVELPNTDKALSTHTLPNEFKFVLSPGEHVFAWVSEEQQYNLDEFRIEPYSTPCPSNIKTIENSNKLDVYPNPFEYELTVTTKSSVINIYNIAGQKIDATFTKTKTGFQLQTDNIPAGIYFIKTNDQVQKVIKK